MLLGCVGMASGRFKAQLELDLARGANKDKKGFCRYINWKRKDQGGVLSTVNNKGRIVTADKEKAEVFNNFLPQSLLVTALQICLEWLVWKVGTGGAWPLPL